jgi:hypothetical protein
MDISNQQRVVALRQEIASLQHNNDTYRLHTRHTKSGDHTNDLRRYRLLAIREELLIMTAPPKGKP